MLIIVFLISIGTTNADGETYDIIEVEFNGSTYYFGQSEFCAYYGTSISSKIYDYFVFRQEVDSVVLYTKLIKINTSKLGFGERSILILKNKVKVSKVDFIGDFVVREITMGNWAGLVYSKDLKETDNDWINDYEIERLFVIESEFQKVINELYLQNIIMIGSCSGC